MSELYLTAYNGKFIGPFARALGWLMDKVYVLMCSIGITNIAVAIIVFTIIIYMALLPLTWRQQKFAMLQRQMQPEIKKVQKKYEGKRDQASMQAMQEETQSIYDKYGVSPMGSCVQLSIQFPILLGLYRVFYNIPAYLSSVKGIFTDLVNGIVGTSGFASLMDNVYKTSGVKIYNAIDFTSSSTSAVKNNIVDVLYKLNDDGWNLVSTAFPQLNDLVTSTHSSINSINFFLGMNISDTPWNMMQSFWSTGAYGMAILALLMPVCSYLSQLLNIKINPAAVGDDQQARQMRSMNLLMPLMSAFISFTVPLGLTIYWIAGALVRTVQMFFLNRHFEKVSLDDIIEKNKAKAEKKAEKRGIRREQMMAAASMSTKNISMAQKAGRTDSDISAAKSLKADSNNTSTYNTKARPGSMASKANLVKDYNERNNKK